MQQKSDFNQMLKSDCCCLPVVGKSCLGRAPAHIQGPEDRIVIAMMEIISNGKKTQRKDPVDTKWTKLHTCDYTHDHTERPALFLH